MTVKMLEDLMKLCEVSDKVPQVVTVKTLEDLMKLCEVSDKAGLTKTDEYALHVSML